MKIEIEYWPENSLPPSTLKNGLDFIHRRFKEVWNIHRIDVTKQILLKRKNVILLNNSNIIGCLGIEKDGELTNACIEKNVNGVNKLIDLIHTAYKFADLECLYVMVPISKTGSAYAFLNSGMRLDLPLKLKRLQYIKDRRSVTLVRLSIDIKNYKSENTSNSKNYIELVLKKISQLNIISNKLQLPEEIIQ